MSLTSLITDQSSPPRNTKRNVVRGAVPLLLAAGDGVAVAATVVVASGLLSFVTTAPGGNGEGARLAVGLVLATLTLATLRGDYRLGGSPERMIGSIPLVWTLALPLVLVLAASRPDGRPIEPLWSACLYLVGLAFLAAARLATSKLARAGGSRVAARRVLVIGSEPSLPAFLTRLRSLQVPVELVGSVVVASVREGLTSSNDELGADLGRAVTLARETLPDEVHLALPWSDLATIDRCLEAFLGVPVAIHVALDPVLGRFEKATVSASGAGTSLVLTRTTSRSEAAAKRVLDVMLAGTALVLLIPLFAFVAILIKRDSPGPVLFRQTRHGFNQQPFRILKFRTMTTFADGEAVAQASRGDGRITRIGRWLRETSVDELPQLVNVLLGHMSLVGPRPHAVAHNREFETKVALYARRHNVRPGITGWAQVNGLRGETDTTEKLVRRVDHDLFYVDNWSFLFDLRILVATVLSRSARSNAY